jgi:hypothetical protein
MADRHTSGKMSCTGQRRLPRSVDPTFQCAHVQFPESSLTINSHGRETASLSTVS